MSATNFYSSTKSTVHTTKGAQDALFQKLEKGKLGFFDSHGLKRSESKARREVQEFELNEVKTAVQDTVAASVRAQAALIKADVVRENATAIAAVVSELQHDASGTAMVLGGERASGSVANLKQRNEFISEVRDAQAKGQISAEDADLQIRTFAAVHEVVEGHIDRYFHDAINTCGRVYAMGHQGASKFEAS